MQAHAEIENMESLLPEQYDSRFYFDLIIKLAQQRDLKGLRELIASDVTCIDIRFGEKTPIQQLACDDQIGSVDFLLNYFDVSLQEAITGFAIAGNIQRVDSLLDQGAFALDAIRGYARGGHHEACRELRTRTVKILKQSEDIECFLAALEGYSLAKDIPYIKEYFYKIKAITDPWVKSLFFRLHDKKIAIQGHRFPFNSDSTHDQTYNALFNYSYISDNYVTQMLGFNKAHDLIDTEPYLFPQQKYIISGNAIRQPDTINQGQIEPACAAKALAFAGHYAMAKGLERDYYDPFNIIFGLAAGGHSQQVHKMLSSICELNPRALSGCIEKAVNGFGRFGHVKLAEKLVMLHEVNIYDLFRALYIGGYLSNTQIILRTQSQFTHPWLQNELINFVQHPLFSTNIRTCIDIHHRRYTHPNYLPKSYLSQTEPPINKLLWQEFIAKQINIELQLTNDMQLSPAQIKAWRRPEVRSWFLNSTAFVKSLHIPRDVFNVLTHHLFSLEMEDIIGIYNKLCMPIFKRLLETNLQSFIKKNQPTSNTMSALILIRDFINNPQEITFLTLDNLHTYQTIKSQDEQANLSAARSLLQNLQQTSATDNNLAITQYADIVRKQHECLSRSRLSLFATPADQEFKGLVSRAVNRL